MLYEDAGTAAVGSPRGGEATSGVREPVCQQRRRQPPYRTANGRSIGRRRHRPRAARVVSTRSRRLRPASTRSPRPSCAQRRGQFLRAAPQPAATAATPQGRGAADDARPRPAFTDPIQAAGPPHRLLEGTFIDAVLTNRLDGTQRRTRQLSGHQPGLLAQRPAHPDSGRCAGARRDDTGSVTGRDAPRRVVPSSRAPGWAHVSLGPVHRAQSDR